MTALPGLFQEVRTEQGLGGRGDVGQAGMGEEHSRQMD